MNDIEKAFSGADGPRPMPEALKEQIVASLKTAPARRWWLDRRLAAGAAALVIVVAGVAIANTGPPIREAAPRAIPITTVEPVGPSPATPAPAVAVGPVTTAPPSKEPGRLSRFASDEAFLAYVKRNGLIISDFGGTGTRLSGDRANSSQSGSTNANFSTSNVQESGVDEADIVKTDGSRIYYLSNANLRIFDPNSSPPRLVTNLMVESATNMFLVGSRLVVIDLSYDQQSLGIFTRLRVLDTNTLTFTSTTRVEGRQVASRMVDGIIRLAVTSGRGPVVRPNEQYEAAVARSTIEDWLPRYSVERNGAITRSGFAVSASQVSYPNEDAGSQMLSVYTFNPASPGVDNPTAVMGAGEILYSSPTSMYVTSSAYSVMTDAGASATASAFTRIHKFDISSPTDARYVASGTIAGALLNQFSMSELGGRLRVAATLRAAQSQSSVLVLEQRGDKLQTIGSVTGLGPSEQIYAVRFIGSRGYVVTFRRTDPLYVIDLSKPTQPKVAGELKIPGYSGYLHPVGEGRLVGVGSDGTEDGRVLGPQISLFDVSNPAAPKRIAQKAFPESYQSRVEHDHLSFLFWAPTGRLVVPMTTGWGEERFSGAVALTVTRDSLSDPVELNHHRGSQKSVPGVDRSVIVGERLITLSVSGALVSDLSTLQEIAWIATP